MTLGEIDFKKDLNISGLLINICVLRFKLVKNVLAINKWLLM